MINKSPKNSDMNEWKYYLNIVKIKIIDSRCFEIIRKNMLLPKGYILNSVNHVIWRRNRQDSSRRRIAYPRKIVQTNLW